MNAFNGMAAKKLGAAFLPMFMLGGPAIAQDTTHPQEMQLPSPTFTRPDPESLRVSLDSGLVAYIAEDHRAPLVTLTAFIGVGSVDGEPGEAAALAAALRRGPAALSPGEFTATLDSMHAEFRVTQGHEETEVFLDVPADAAWQAMHLMGDLLERPAFEGAVAVDKPRSSASGAIDYNYSLDSAVSLFKEALFAGHVTSRTASATAEGAARLHASHVVAKNITLAVAGDFERKKAAREARRAFAAVSAAAMPSRDPLPELKSPSPRSLRLSDVDRGQGWVVIGHELPVVPQEDEAALAVMDYILGAYHLDSRLYRSSRELRGLTNDNSSFLEPGVRGPGAYSFRTYGRPEAVRLLVDLTFRELKAIRETTPTETELFVAQGALVDGIYAQRYATGVAAARAYAIEWLRRGNHRRSASYPRRVRAVSPGDVQAVANKYIDPQRMIVAVVGPLERIRQAPQIESEPQLESWGTAPARD